MESINKLNPERAGPAQNSSKTVRRPEDDVALSRLLAKDPVLGEVMKILFGKLDETNKRLDDLQGERQRNLHLGQYQVNKVPAAEDKVDKGDQYLFPLLAFPPAVQAEDKSDDDKGRKAVEDCLGLEAIRGRILEQLSDKELIKLSLVNKLWNFEARSMLRDRGCLKAKITSEPTCQSLVSFASDLQQMRVVPFTGIHVDMGHEYGSRKTCQSTATGSLDSSYQVILDKLPTKNLSVHFPIRWTGSKECPLFVLAIRILEKCCGALEELSISTLNNSSAEFIQTIIQGYSFPCLKTLKYDDFLARLPSDFAKALVSSAPNLENFYVATNGIYFMENVMEGSSAELVVPSFNPLSDRVCESLIGALRTEIMVLRVGRDLEVELLNKFVPMMLQASSTTLKTLQLHLHYAVPLMCYGICMENVTDLWIFTSDITVNSTQPDFLRLLKGFDFTRVFPKLDKVTIKDDSGCCCRSDVVSAFLERGNAILRKNFPDRATNIKQLHLKRFFVDPAPPLPLLGQMFPHVQTLSVEEAKEDFPFTYLWQFGCLTELHVGFQGSSFHIENLDSVFCGIFSEEVAELRAKDDEYLKAVNIVPVMPSITCLRGLRLFQLQYVGWNPRKDSNRLFSKVTGLIGFRRCPTLSVKLQTKYSTEGLDHMRPYVTLENIQPLLRFTI